MLTQLASLSASRRLAGLLILAAMGTPVPAASFWNGAAVEYGVSDSSYCALTLGRVALQHFPDHAWHEGESWRGTCYWDFSAGRWDNHSFRRTNTQVADLGVTPVFRLERKEASGATPYLEGAVGLHWLSRTSVSRTRVFGSSFAFGDHLGFGLLLGTQHTYELGYRFQHLSNAGLATPNKGINYHLLRFGAHF